MKKVLMVAAATTLVMAGSAGGYVAGRVVTVRPGGAADFVPDSNPASVRWYCSFRNRNLITCRSGDAHPYVDLTVSRPGGITVRVYTLMPESGRATRKYVPTETVSGRRKYLAYTFTAG